MVFILTNISRFSLLFMILIYTYDCFAALRSSNSYKREQRLYHKQTVLMIGIVVNANLVMIIKTAETKYLVFLIMELVFFGIFMLIYKGIYHHLSYSLINNMCMLLAIGFIALTRLDYDKALKQFFIAVAALIITCFVPVLVQKMKLWNKLKWVYALIGISLLGVVTIFGTTTYGAKLNITILGITIQPSEFVKIIYVFYIACMFMEMEHDDNYKFLINFKSTDFLIVLLASVGAALHVLMLVGAKDLGTACIFYITYLVMLYVASKKVTYLLLGTGLGAGAFLIASKLFTHVQTRIIAWQDPLSVANDGGYQVSQSLFAIGTGGWFGSGIMQGSPNKIPIVVSDFIFAGICEEYGALFGICLILICMSCFLMIFNVAMQISDFFYKMIALGLGTVYAVQVFMCLGGVTKFIPSTGITLPFVSYGGSSLLASFILFAVIQGIYAKEQENEEYYDDYEEE